ncbi:hypothetical protein HYN56_16485 [Flavobacterium crocinum]|uniref:Lantibiotic biosynthesis protein n=1 Tax=Flavobacterium crocinum TaxID=2183896 RepID=A0A2S1YNS8_9FLAO|nr:lanthionine synthetase LanC family protein [Flavobacterium crocinum]AWK05747.1 hypothetical protein HYN56_16485 [Flavobacterium crocinum]
MDINNELHKILQSVNNHINKEYIEVEHLGILSGLSGAALFQFYYSAYTNDNSDNTTGIDIIGYCIQKINNGYGYPTYCGGIAGFTWMLQHLSEQNLIDLKGINLKDFEPYLYNCMLEDIKIANYDYLHGATGYALYFLERFKVSDSVNDHFYKSYIIDFIHFLEENSVVHNGGIIWLTKDHDNKGGQNYNLGLAHGVASIIGILLRLSGFEDFKEKSEKLLKKAVTALIKQMNDIALSDSYFASLVPFGSADYSKNSRLAWCYGDLGIGLQLLYYSKIINDKNLNLQAKSVLKHCASRRSYDKTLILDATVCHGAFGVALMFNNAFRNTLDLTFLEARDYWLRFGIQLWENKDKITEVHSVAFGDDKISVLNGMAGIGLAIISCISDLNQWESSLMLHQYE